MADGNKDTNFKRNKNKPQKLIYTEEKEGEKRSWKKNQIWKACTNLREYIGMAAMLFVCCGISFLLVQYPKLTPTVLQ